MEWSDISTCPEHTKAVFGYMSQFDEWVFEVFHDSSLPIKYGYTHWLKIVPPQLRDA